MNDHLSAPGSSPLHLCLPVIWGIATDDLLDPHYSLDILWKPVLKKKFQGLKIKYGLPYGAAQAQN
jgi:hypothetical protein